MFHITEIRRTSWVCPALWEGTTEEGEEVKIEYRWGTLTVNVGGKVVFSKHIGKPTTEAEDDFIYESMRRQGWEKSLIERIKKTTDAARKAAAESKPLCFDGLIAYKEMVRQTAEICNLPAEESFNCTKPKQVATV